MLDKKLHDNKLESYLLAWIMAGYHTETDSWYKHHRKGFLFTLGDEPNLNVVPGEDLEHFLGYQKGAKDITAQEALEKAREQYEVFHIHITNANYPTSRVERGWKGLVGEDHFLTANSNEVANVIADTIREHYVPVDESVIETETVVEEAAKEEIKEERTFKIL